MTDTAPAIEAMLAEHADLERASPTPNCTPTPAAARKVGRRFAQLSPDRRDLPQARNGPR